MHKTDYIIVGDGFAAMFFAHQLIINKKSFLLFSDTSNKASQMSAGIVNPLVLKRFTKFWLADEQIHYFKEIIKEISDYTRNNYIIDEQIHRVIHNEIEKDLWIKKSKNIDIQPYLNLNFESIENIINPFDTGKINSSMRLNVKAFFLDFFTFLSNHHFLVKEEFQYDKIKFEDKAYKNISFKNIVFAEGMGVLQNPLFKELPIDANKGHHLKVKLSKPIKKGLVIKKKHFLFNIEEDIYYYGGTYDRDSKNTTIDESAKSELVEGLQEIYPYPFEILEVNFGFRPTVNDRRPILGQHFHYKDAYIFNGLGARGILNASYFAKDLYNFIEYKEPLLPEINLNRFSQKDF